jgi:general secretion pathway protein F
MPRYRYTATDIAGNRREGVLESNSPEELDTKLRAEGLRVDGVHLIEPCEPSREKGRLSSLDVVEVTRQLASLERAGMPLPDGLRALSDELASKPLRRVLLEMASAVEAGQPLEQAVENQGDRFPKYLRALVLAGLRSGKLGETLEQFARYHHVGRELKRKVWLSFAYPLVLMICLAFLFVLVCKIIVSDFARIFDDFGVPLPRMTKALIGVSESVTGVGPYVVLGLAGAALSIWLAGLSFGGAGWRRGLTSPIPLLGPMWRWTALVEFANLLALLLESEMPLPLALQLTGEGSRDADVASTCRGMVKLVEAGLPLSDALERMQRFPASLPHILRWAESTHSLPGSLHLAADMYEARARAQATFAGITCTMITVIFVLWGASMIVVALFLPLIQLISKLSG